MDMDINEQCYVHISNHWSIRARTAPEQLHNMIYIGIIMAWNCVISSFFYGTKSIQDKMDEIGRITPEWVSIPYDVVIFCLLAYGGWFVTAFGYFIHMAALYNAHQESDKRLAERASGQGH